MVVFIRATIDSMHCLAGENVLVSIAGLIVHHTEKPIHSWDSDTIDHIVKKGNFMLRDALENSQIPDKQTLSIDELGAVVGWFSIERIAKPLSATGKKESERVS